MRARDAASHSGSVVRPTSRRGELSSLERTSVTCLPAGVNCDAARSVVSRVSAFARNSSSLACSSVAQPLARPVGRSRPRGVSRAATSKRSRSADSIAPTIATYASAGYRTEAVGRRRPESRPRTTSRTSRPINP
jgi:hypothetical protein